MVAIYNSSGEKAGALRESTYRAPSETVALRYCEARSIAAAARPKE